MTRIKNVESLFKPSVRLKLVCVACATYFILFHVRCADGITSLNLCVCVCVCVTRPRAAGVSRARGHLEQNRVVSVEPSGGPIGAIWTVRQRQDVRAGQVGEPCSPLLVQPVASRHCTLPRYTIL